MRSSFPEFSGVASFEDIEEGITYRIERDDQTGFAEKCNY
jgi:DNA-directed RNA polymerase subunit beta'